MSSSVRVLDPSLCSNIRSAHTVDSVPQCVVELVHNSVDAVASSVVVKVDTSSWRIQVSDNGNGIPRDQLTLVGQRYATSKCRDLQDSQCPQYFGFRGEALASIVQVAHTVEITSRHQFSQQTWRKVFKRGCGSGVVSASSLNEAGTIVNVHGLFYNMPVRRRHISPSLVVNRLKNVLCKAFLVLPLISFSVYNEQTGQYILNVSCTNSLLNRFGQLFGTEKALETRQTSVECAGLKVHALLSTQPLNSQCLQLIYVNRRPVENQSLHMLVHRLLVPALSNGHKNKTLTQRIGKQQPLYVIVINSGIDFATCLHLAKSSEEGRVHAALTHLLSIFISENHLSTSRCHSSTNARTSCSNTSLRKETRYKRRESHDSVFSATKSTRSCSALQTYQPQATSVSQRVAIPWKTIVDPTTSHTLHVHPVSGCSYTSDRTLVTTVYHCNRVSSKANGSSKSSSEKAQTSLQNTVASSLLSGWKNPTFSAGEEAVLVVGGSHGAHTHCKFSKSCLQRIKVFGQVERKFIACLLEAHNSSSPDLLVAIDQHAAHERVRLESLMEGLYDEQHQVCVAEVVPPLFLALAPFQEKMAYHFSEQLVAIGIQLQCREGQLVTRTLPRVLMVRGDGEKGRGRPAVTTSVVKEMVCSHLQLLQSTGGGMAGLPSSLAAVLHSQACHGAIRFGDSLCLAECQELVHSLTCCALPFQCAHGRPSLVPLIDLHLLRRQFPGLHTPFPVLEGLTTAAASYLNSN